MNAIVIGGGPAGCAAARRLRELGHEVVLLEAEDHLGGRTWTLRGGGYSIDAGAIVIGTAFSRTLALIEGAGRRDEFETFEPTIGFLDGSRRCVLRPNSLRNFFALPLLDWRTKLKVTLRAAALPQALFDEGAIARTDSGESAAAWARRCFGDRGYEYAIRPMVQFLGLPAEELSAGFAARLLRNHWRIRLLRLAGGIGSFAECIVAGLDVRTGQRAEQVRTGTDGVRVSTAEGATHIADAAIVATDAAVAAKLLGSSPGAAALSQVEYLPALHVSLGFEHDPWPHLAADWIMPVGIGEHPIVIAGLLSHKSPRSLPAGAQVADLYFSRTASARLSDREAVEYARRSAGFLLGGPMPKPAFEHIFRFPRALPVLRPGSASRLSALRDVGNSRIAVAGDYMSYPSIETAARSGESAADRIHRAGGERGASGPRATPTFA